jgi:uncharacterized protein YktB (UPF0637 family)
MPTTDKVRRPALKKAPVLSAKRSIKPPPPSGEAPVFLLEDFAVFEVPGFKARMPLLRERVKPKLIQIGEHLNGTLSTALKEPLHTHVAQHLRRTVNAPEATWVAFSRAARAYKPFVHVRVAINANSVRTSVFVEDYADDKLLFADNLSRHAEELAAYLAKHPQITAYNITDQDGNPKSGYQLDAETLRQFANRMHRVKGLHAVFGVDLDRKRAAKKSGQELLKAVRKAVSMLKPLYDCGKARKS